MNPTRGSQLVKQLQEVAEDSERAFQLDAASLVQEYLNEMNLRDETSTCNFSEVALVLQAYAHLYSRRVDFLYDDTVSLLQGGAEVEPPPAAAPAATTTSAAATAPATPVRRNRATAAAPLDFVLIDEPPCSRARRPRRPLTLMTARPPPLLLAPPDNRPRSLQLFSYDGESLGPLASFSVMSTLRDGMLCDDLAPLEDEPRPRAVRRSQEFNTTDPTLEAAEPDETDRDLTDPGVIIHNVTDQDDIEQDVPDPDVIEQDVTVVDVIEQDMTVVDVNEQDVTVADVVEQDVTDRDITDLDVTGTDTSVFNRSGTVKATTPQMTTPILAGLSTSQVPPNIRPPRGRQRHRDGVELTVAADCLALLERSVEYSVPREWVNGVVSERALQLAAERGRGNNPQYLAACLDTAGGLRGFCAEKPAPPAVSPGPAPASPATPSPAVSPGPVPVSPAAPSPVASPEPEDDGPSLVWARRVVELASRRADPDLSRLREALLRALPDEGALQWEALARHDLLREYSPSAVLLTTLMLANAECVDLRRPPELNVGCLVTLRSRDPALYRGAGAADHLYFAREQADGEMH